jgi:ABC-type uncharacterized transport system permease subunit
MTELLGIAAALLYLAIATTMISRGRRGKPYAEVKRTLTLVASAALLCHAIVNLRLLFVEDGVDLSFFRISSTFAWFVASIALVSSIRAPIDKLLIPIYLFAAASLPPALLLPGSPTPHSAIPPGVATHILVSILAYSVMTIGACQATFLAVQNHQLRTGGRMGGLINALPPLQSMEHLLFQILWAGEILLTLSIASGAIFLEDLFAQHLAHKSFFAIAAWLIFAVLLWGRHQWGWRGQQAVRWTLAGFAILMLAYFGSKFVLEMVLQP